MAKSLLPLLLVFVAIPVLMAHAGGQAADAALDRANRLLREQPIIDGHNDYPWAVREKGKSDLDAFDMRKPQPQLMTDFARLRAGGVGGQFWSVYVPVELQGQAAVTATLEQIDLVHRMLAKYPDTLELALTADDVVRIQKAGKIASLIGMEGGHSIDNSLGTLRMMYRLGARYMTITHTANTPWADAATDTPKNHGVNSFGEEVFREMNRLGMLIDLSHVSPDTMAAALRVSQAPVIFSHSSAKALTNVPRDVPDDILRELAKNGGVIMITFVPGFVSQEVADYNAREDAERARLKPALASDDAVSKQIEDVWRKANPRPRATIRQVADHVDHVKQVAGIDHIGLGGDFDGITAVVQGLEDTSKYPNLIAELIRRGYSDADVKKIAGENILRALRGAEATAKRLQGGKVTP
jgi:membrane dipeptidase